MQSTARFHPSTGSRWWLVALLAVWLPALSPAVEITVFAAASLTESLKEIAATYEKKTGDRILLNFGASSFLARQIEEGAPADIFFSADEARLDGLETKGLIVKESRRSVLANSLVIITAADSPLQIKSVDELTRVKRFALADPKTVPAGIYARQYLEKVRLWQTLEPKVVPVDNVRAVLAAVESGNVDAGMVYDTDAAISKKIKLACRIPAAETPDISYPLAVIKSSKHLAATRKFAGHLASEEAGRIFAKHGFIVRKSAA